MANFQDIYGQEQLKENLENALQYRKISHAYIINGERSSGKEFIADIFAMALECDSEGKRPCQECQSCKQALHGNHPDIKKVLHEKPNTISVEDIREQINNDIVIKPYRGPYKIYIMNEGEKMTPQAQNALLKTLEEPPEYAVIIILTTRVEALLPTILSRCIVLNMKPVADDLVKQYLVKEMQIPDYRIDICAAFARGNIGRAKLLASSEEFDKVKEEVLSLMRHIHEMEVNEVVAAVKRISEYKMNVDDYLDICLIWYRDILLYKATNDMNHLIFKDEIKYIKSVALRSSYEGIEEIINALEKTKSRINANVNFDLSMELLLLTIKENS